MRRLSELSCLSIFCFLILLSSCLGPPPRKTYSDCPQDSISDLYNCSVSLFYNRLDSDITQIENYRKEQLITIRNIVATRNFQNISQAFSPITSAEKMLDFYSDRMRLPARYNENAYGTAMISYSFIVESLAEMTLEVADMYRQLGMRDEAKKYYRLVITTYTGNAYKSQVKKAEFGLEDLK